MHFANEKCKRCGGQRLASVMGKTADRCSWDVKINGKLQYRDGYVPLHLGICEDNDNDYINFAWCLDCGQMQTDEFPVDEVTLGAALEKAK